MITLERESVTALPDLKVVETDRDRFDRARKLITGALRANAEKQITGRLYDSHGNFCFVGCAANAIKGDG